MLYCDRQYWYSRPGPGEEDYPFPAPFDTGFYLIMNVAVGGSFTGGLIDDVSKLRVEEGGKRVTCNWSDGRSSCCMVFETDLR